MTITLTHSDLATFLTCRRKFDLAYINDFGKPESTVGPLALGTRVHASIEAMHRDGTNPIEEHQRLALRDERWLIDSGAPSWDVDQLYEDIIFGRNCIDAYTEWVAAEGPYDGYKIHPEQMLEGLICGGQVLLKGKADLLLEREDDGWIFINDLKTASVHSRTSLPALLEKSYQHHVYMVLAHLTHPEQIIGGASYTVLYKVKVPLRATHPMVESIPAHATWRQAATKLRQIEQIAYEIIRMGACNPNVPGAVMSEALLSRFPIHVELTTDWSLAGRLGVPTKIIQVARNLNQKAKSGEVTSAPQLRELLTFKKLAAQFGEQFALNNFLGQIRPENREIASSLIESVYGSDAKPTPLTF